MTTDFLSKGIEHVTRAAEEDKNQNFPEAFRLYSIALEYFTAALKYEKNERRKETIRKKVVEYLNRAEQIKKVIDENKDRPEGSGSGTASKQKGTKDDEVNEDAKLRKAMEGSILVEKPDVSWEDVAGLEGAKEALKEAVIFPIKFPHIFVGKRDPWHGILLYGPPGTGKSYLAKAVATEANATFFSVSSSDIVSKWLGESEKQVKQLFELGRENKPSIIFIDEIDSLCSARSESDSESGRRIKNEFLVQMNGLGNDMDGVLVLAATNMPWALDGAIRRRFDKRIYIGLPEASARATMFDIHLGDTPHTCTQDDLRELAEMCDGFSGSDIQIVVREALMMPIRMIQYATHYKRVTAPDRDNKNQMKEYWLPCSPGDIDAVAMTWEDIDGDDLLEPIITKNHFIRSIHTNRPTVNEEDLSRHIEFTAQYGQEA